MRIDSNVDCPKTIIASFCTGYGGLEIGISRAMFGDTITIVYCEREMFAVKNLLAKIEQGIFDAAPIHPDLTSFPYRRFRGMVDIACAGIPCQPHSSSGKREGGSDERFLFDKYFDGLAEMQPKQIIIENVEGFLSSKMPDGRLCFGYVLRRLEEIGYSIEDKNGNFTAGIFSAEEVGAPHRRKRVFILADSISHRSGTRVRVTGRCNEKEKSNHNTNSSSKLANTNCFRGREGPDTVWQWQSKFIDSSKTRWPAGRGQPQYEWEAKRTVANAEIDDWWTVKRNTTLGSKPGGRGALKSGVGRAIDGVAYRIDKLRLLGGGVAPATAERAIRLLSKRLEEE